MTLAINALILNKNRAGIGNYACELLRALEALEPEIAIEVYIQRHMASAFKGTRAMRYIPCPDFSSSRERILFEQLKLNRRLIRRGCSAVHYLDYHTPLWPAGVKMIATLHDLSYYSHPQFFTLGSRRLKGFLTAHTVRRADRIICVSNHTQKDVLARFPRLRPQKTAVIPLGVKAFHQDAAKDEFRQYLKNAGVTEPYVLYVGTLEPRKNVECLIQSFDAAVSQSGIPHSLLLCGQPGWMTEGIYRAVREAVHKDRIHFGGYVPEGLLVHLYSNAEVLVYPSWYEGFGLPPLEAMACGTPVIASNAASLPETVGDAAKTFSPADGLALTRLLIQVLEDPMLRQEMRSKGRDQAARFDWRLTAEQTLQVYREVLSEGGAQR